MSGSPHLVVRADGGSGIGSGHLARCLALTQGWIDAGGTVTLVSTGLPADWATRYRREGAEVCELGAAGFDGADWAVLDGYRFTRDDQEAILAAGCRLLSIDDHGALKGNVADLVLDQNLGASARAYAGRSPRTDLLLGPRYALLRREFRAAHREARVIAARATRLLVAAGGAPAPSTRTMFDAIVAQPALAGMEVRWLSGTDEVVPALAGTDLALAASGSTTWELCCTGLPAVLLAVAANQEPVARAVAEAGAAHNAGSLDAVDPSAVAAAVAALAADPDRRAAMSRIGRDLVDGRGAKRVVARLRADLLVLRSVTTDDARLLWEWTNDPAVRASGRSPAPIPWESHVVWLSHRLADPASSMWLAAAPDSRPVGVVRFKQEGAAAEISVSVAPERRGQGWGPALIDAGVRRVFAEPSLDRVVARIKPHNHASRSSFEDAAFTSAGEGDEDGIHWVFYERARSSDE